MAHAQVFAHQEFDELHVLGLDLVVPAKLPHLGAAQLGVVPTAAFGDVVKEGSCIKDPRLVPTGCELGAKGVLVGMLHDEKTPHISEHHQDVLIHGVDVKEVVLHLAHDASKDPQVAPQHRRLVHQTHGVGDALGFF